MGITIKKLGRKPIVRRAASAAIAGSILTVKATTRWQTLNSAAAEPAWAGKTPTIIAFWHNRLAMMPICWPSQEPFHMLISSHPDGQLVARAIAHFGIGAVAGSSTRGGSDALRTLVRTLKSGESIGITPDGPRGPRMRAGEGAVALARLSGAPVLPVSVSVSRRKVLGTWDRLIVPLPFGRGAVVWGNPINVPPDADTAEISNLTEQLELMLNTISAEADRLAGHEAMSPADMPHASQESSDARA